MSDQIDIAVDLEVGMNREIRQPRESETDLITPRRKDAKMNCLLGGGFGEEFGGDS